jgi:enterochelin esterase family protein
MKQYVIIPLIVSALALCSCSRPAESVRAGSVERDTLAGVPCCVYLPAGYSQVAGKRKFPVLYLQHGMYGNEDDWTAKGRLVEIMDSLLQAGEVKEMVVIMPDNCPGRPTSEEEKANATTGEWEANFATFMAEAESEYRISAEPAQRAIAGLSMGGYHTMRVSYVLDGQFEYVAMFSPATFVHNAPTRRRVFWLAIGTEDFLWDSFQEYREWLEAEHIEYTYYESTGGHDWPNWQDYIGRFLPKLFKN